MAIKTEVAKPSLLHSLMEKRKGVIDGRANSSLDEVASGEKQVSGCLRLKHSRLPSEQLDIAE